MTGGARSDGPGRFVTCQTYMQDGQERLWQSRHHRKSLSRDLQMAELDLSLLLRALFMPRQINWWIGGGFAIGALLFVAGSVMSFLPGAFLSVTGANLVYFLGSLFFTTAAGLQLFQSANSGEFKAEQGARLRGPVVLIGWKPKDIGWLSSAAQFVGTLLFNANTLDALIGGGNWLWQDLTIWGPDVAGSLLFLISGYLAVTETCHGWWRWQPRSLSWWLVMINLSGCAAFMISAFFAFVAPSGGDPDRVTLAVAFTLVGAVGFLLGSLLMLAEGTASEA